MVLSTGPIKIFFIAMSGGVCSTNRFAHIFSSTRRYGCFPFKASLPDSALNWLGIRTLNWALVEMLLLRSHQIPSAGNSNSQRIVCCWNSCLLTRKLETNNFDGRFERYIPRQTEKNETRKINKIKLVLLFSWLHL